MLAHPADDAGACQDSPRVDPGDMGGKNSSGGISSEKAKSGSSSAGVSAGNEKSTRDDPKRSTQAKENEDRKKSTQANESEDRKKGTQAQESEELTKSARASPKYATATSHKEVKPGAQSSAQSSGAKSPASLPPNTKPSTPTTSVGTLQSKSSVTSGATSGVRDTLEQAISMGAPAYNAGDIRGCADMYGNAARRALKLAGDDTKTGSSLRAALQTSQRQSSQQAAWTLRRSFDSIIKASVAASPRPGTAASDRASVSNTGSSTPNPLPSTQSKRGATPKPVVRASNSARSPTGTATARSAADLKAAARRATTAIAQGVPLFNNGDIAGCVRVYQQCCQSIVEDLAPASVASSKQFVGDIRSAMLAALASRSQDRDRAWALRIVLDRVIAAA